jgi:hypothetical protein
VRASPLCAISFYHTSGTKLRSRSIERYRFGRILLQNPYEQTNKDRARRKTVLNRLVAHQTTAMILMIWTVMAWLLGWRRMVREWLGMDVLRYTLPKVCT